MADIECPGMSEIGIFEKEEDAIKWTEGVNCSKDSKCAQKKTCIKVRKWEQKKFKNVDFWAAVVSCRCPLPGEE
jgi:hypothetical protein